MLGHKERYTYNEVAYALDENVTTIKDKYNKGFDLLQKIVALEDWLQQIRKPEKCCSMCGLNRLKCDDGCDKRKRLVNMVLAQIPFNIPGLKIEKWTIWALIEWANKWKKQDLYNNFPELNQLRKAL